MTNLEYMQQLGKKEGLEYLRGICPLHPCRDCGFKHDGDACGRYTAGSDGLAEWLYEEHKEHKEGEK